MRELAERPFAFDFYSAVRRTECLRSDLPRIGYSQKLADDPLRFCQEPSLAFAPSNVSDLKFSGPDGPASPRLFVNFMGLWGPNGPLPSHLTEFARDRERNHQDPTLARFCDVFHHRMVSLFYRAWASCQKTVHLERENDPLGDRFAAFIGSLVGLGMESFSHRDGVPDSAKRYFTGRLAHQQRNAEGLQAIIGEYFGVPTRVHEFVGRWMPLPENCQCRLGQSRQTGLLGRTSIVGSTIWECQQKFRIRLGPLSLRDFERFLPGTTGMARMADWARLYTCDELCWDMQLVLKAKQVPEIRLGKSGRLGWTTWARSAPETRDRADLVLTGTSA